MMEKSCGNCRFCIAAKSMRGKAELYCERHSKWIGNTILCSEWEAVIVPKPLTNADRIRAMTDEELAHLLHSAEEHLFTGNLWNYDKWTEWLKQEANDAN